MDCLGIKELSLFTKVINPYLYMMIKEETELEQPSTYKTKSFWKEGEIWTTSEKEKKKAKIEEIKAGVSLL